MRILPSLLALVIALTGRLFSQNSDPITVTGTIPDKFIVQPVGTPPIDLRGFFAVPTISGQVVQFTAVTSLSGTGTPVTQKFNVVMDSLNAPNTVANFLNYVNANRFTNSIIHRSDQPLGIIQGGGYLNDSNLTTITKNAALNMETTDSLLSLRGTLAMARLGGDVNSATSEWFINTADNSANLPPASSLGYAVFGRVTGTGMSVVDSIQALQVLGGNVTVTSSSTDSQVVTFSSAPANIGPKWGLLGSSVQSVIGSFITLTQNANQTIDNNTGPLTFASSIFAKPFDQLPVLQSLPADGTVNLSNLVTVNSITAVPIFPATPGGASVVTFSAASSHPNLVSASISGSNLYIAAASNLTTGPAAITVTATDSNENTAQTQFFVTVTRKVLDFNGDGNPEFVLQNSIGQLFTWYMNSNGTIASSGFLSTSYLADWKLRGYADLNGDGNPDFLFQNTAGEIFVWYMTATGSISKGAYIYSGGGLSDWRLAGLTDLNHDGKTDIILQNSIGQVFAWYMNGNGGIASSGFVCSSALSDWKLLAIADMNSDGFPDFILQNTVGQIFVWFMTGDGAIGAGAFLYPGGLSDWKIAAATDLNGDGKTDLIFQNTIGQIFAWYLNGSGGLTGSGFIYSGGGLPDWRLH
jgi:cyclophilin family peptidyl-prolyl cis-trans isomerase